MFTPQVYNKNSENSKKSGRIKMKAITRSLKPSFHSNFTQTIFTLIFKVVILAHMLKTGMWR